ncbi:MAG: HAMP domain-containing protein [Candidatus Omnitrophica bacterium]|nr:HAMP domain-containing protein [Candidatus Omnitrophota bacterium]
MKLRLHWKLTAFFCSAVMIGLFLGYFFLTAHLKSFLDQDLQKNLKREIVLSKGFIENESAAARTLEDPYALAKRIGVGMGCRVTIVAVDGVVLGDSSLTREEVTALENHAGRPEIKEALRTGFGESRRYSFTLKKELLYQAVPFGRDKVLGILRFAMPLSDVELFENGLDRVVLFGFFLVFVMSLGFTYLMSVILSRPLREMATVAKAMAEGDFSRTPSIRSKDEVGELAGAITHMSQQIRSRIEDIEEEKAKLDAVLASMFEGIMVVDDKGVVQLMNPSLRKIFFIDAPPEGRRAVEIVRNSVVTEMAEKLLKGSERFVSREVFVGFPEEKMLKANGVAIRAHDKLEGAVFVFHDITELRRLEKVRQDFVANVSHELRTPVASIKGYAETLLQGAMDDKAALKEFLDTIYQNSDRLVNLINDLLDLARIQSGKLSIVPAVVEVEPVIRRCLGVLEKTVEAKRLVVNVRIPPEAARVLADESRFSQVVLNLLDNAVKYTLEGGVITVGAVVLDSKVRIDVTDTGIGIPEEDLPRIFERFYRVDKARSRDQGGTGLGLSIVKHIVIAHGGEVLVSSVLGQGTTFSFTLPVA